MEKEENSSSSSSNRAVISHPPGLYNPGRHCYLNALLQNLFNIKAFRWVFFLDFIFFFFITFKCILNFQSKPPLDPTIVALKNIFENMLRGYVFVFFFDFVFFFLFLFILFPYII
jgi:ubiquitin C-terminal hydrolase